MPLTGSHEQYNGSTDWKPGTRRTIFKGPNASFFYLFIVIVRVLEHWSHLGQHA